VSLAAQGWSIQAGPAVTGGPRRLTRLAKARP